MGLNLLQLYFNIVTYKVFIVDGIDCFDVHLEWEEEEGEKQIIIN